MQGCIVRAGLGGVTLFDRPFGGLRPSHFSSGGYTRVSGKDRRFIKGQKYTLLSNHENLSTDGRKALKTLLAANKRLNTAYVLKESFSRLWDYSYEGSARKFFDNWKASLKWQKLKPFEDFAAMVERHWEGIVAYFKPENKVSLGRHSLGWGTLQMGSMARVKVWLETQIPSWAVEDEETRFDNDHTLATVAFVGRGGDSPHYLPLR